MIWCVPIGICSLIIAKLGHDGNFWAKLEQLSVFVGTTSSCPYIHKFFFATPHHPVKGECRPVIRQTPSLQAKAPFLFFPFPEYYFFPSADFFLTRCGAVTVVLGLGFHMFVFLPCVYAFIVRKNPFVVRNTPLYCVLSGFLVLLGLRLVPCTTCVL